METIYKKCHIFILRYDVCLMQRMTAKRLVDELYKSRPNGMLTIGHPEDIHDGRTIFVVELCIDGHSYVGRGNSTEFYLLIFQEIPVRLPTGVPE